MNASTRLSAPVQCPPHVDQSTVFDFDMFRDPGLRADPHARLVELAATAPPVFWTPRNGGHWVLLGREAVFEGARDTQRFSSEAIPHARMQAMLALLPPDQPRVPVPYPILLDPPAHAKYRQPLQTVFSPRTVAGLRDKIRTLAAALIDSMLQTAKARGSNSCEFIAAIAEPLPVQIFLEMLGLPLERSPEYRALVKENFAGQEDDNADPASMARMLRMASLLAPLGRLLGRFGLSLFDLPVFSTLLRRRMASGASGPMMRLAKVAAIMREDIMARREAPRDDILSMLWQAEIDGRAMTCEDMENYGVLLFIAGLDTVMNAMGHAVRHLACDQALQLRLRADPALIPRASEEMLRRYGFVIPVRRVAQDTTFMGHAMKADERVVLHLPAAGLDPAAYKDPGRYDLDREQVSHLAFNAGPHRCLGAHLARLEVQTLYEELLARMPQFHLDPARAPRFSCSHVIGIEELHICWDAPAS